MLLFCSKNGRHRGVLEGKDYLWQASLGCFFPKEQDFLEGRPQTCPSEEMTGGYLLCLCLPLSPHWQSRTFFTCPKNPCEACCPSVLSSVPSSSHINLALSFGSHTFVPAAYWPSESLHGPVSACGPGSFLPFSPGPLNSPSLPACLIA